MGASHRFNQHLREGVHARVNPLRAFQPRETGWLTPPRFRGVGEPWLVSLSSEGFGSLLGAHPGNDTESDLVDHVSDVVEDSHDFSRDGVEDTGFWVEEVADGVDDPADHDEVAEGVGAPHELWGNLAVVDTLTGCLLYTSPSPRD